jgi:arabinooligosaccharide transport system substrate-binding protein
MRPPARTPSLAQNALSRRRLLTVGGALGLGAVASPLLAGCSSDSSDKPSSSGSTDIGKDPFTLTMWTWDPGHIKFFKSQEKVWNADSANAKLTLDIQQIDPSTAGTKLLAAITAGSGAPDLAAIGINDMPLFFAHGLADNALVPLNDYIADIRDEFSESKWAVYSDAGQTYAVESTMGPTVMYYRSDEFDQYGLPPGFSTIDEWQGAARTLKADEKYIVALDVGSTDFVPLDWQQWFIQHGGNIFDADGNVVFDQGDHAAAVTELYVSLIKDELTIPLPSANGDAVRSAAYKDGSLIATNGPDWWGTYIIQPDVPEQKGKWRMAPMAKFGESIASTFGGAGFAITQQAEDPDAAYAFLASAYLTLEGQVARWKEIEYFPTMIEAWTDPSVIGFTSAFYGGQEIGKVFAKVAADEPVYYTGAAANRAQGIICTELINPAADGSRSIDEGISAATQKLKDAVDELA